MKTAQLFLLTLGSLLQVMVLAQGPSSDVADLAFRNADFAMNLYREIASASDDNVFFSPLSVSLALAALSTGAQGTTREKILQGLSLASLEQEGQPELIPELFQKLLGEVTQNAVLQFNPATAVFARQPPEAAFSDVIKKYFGVDTRQVDFGNERLSKTSINDYVRGMTGDKVTEIVGSVDQQAMLMLISSIFFQGNWGVPFSANFTQEERFFVSKYSTVQVPMMFSSNKYYLAYDPSFKLGVLKLPYQGGVAMLVLLPDKEVDYTSIDEVVNGERFIGWVKKLKKTNLEVQLPRFSLEQSYAMKTVLPAMGITNLFEDADLSGVSKENLNLSEMLHKAAIEVKESGSSTLEGAAPPRLTINRPFLFVIYHEATLCPLFMGRVINPTTK
ncbi:hypothetical protein GJAV_G00108280 [Gymnothorax javanicus]|nr:hypothetical protein GJAV_G00108280 [Gymnothorax javanicus]